MTNTEFIRWFETIKIADRPTVGGKGASLGELTAAGIRVPPGFVVTTSAFERFLQATDTDGSIRRTVAGLTSGDTEGIGKTTVALREGIRKSPFPEDLAAEVRLC